MIRCPNGGQTRLPQPGYIDKGVYKTEVPDFGSDIGVDRSKN